MTSVVDKTKTIINALSSYTFLSIINSRRPQTNNVDKQLFTLVYAITLLYHREVCFSKILYQEGEHSSIKAVKVQHAVICSHLLMCVWLKLTNQILARSSVDAIE